MPQQHKHKLTYWKKGFPLRLCKCGYMDGIYPKIGQNSIDIGAAGDGDIVRWSATQAALAAGDIGMSASDTESQNGRPSAFIQGEAQDIISVDGLRGGGKRRVITIQPNANGTSLALIGITTAPTTIGTPTVVDVSTGEGQFIQYASGAVANNEAGVVGAAFTQTQRIYNPILDVGMRTAASIAVQRTWIGLCSADPMASDTPAVHLMAFRYSPATDTTAFWRCVTDNASGTPTVTTTTVAITTTTSYRLRIVCDAGGAAVRFYINGILVATHTTTLPTSTQNLGHICKVRTLEAVAKSIRFGRMNLSQKASV